MVPETLQIDGKKQEGVKKIPQVRPIFMELQLKSGLRIESQLSSFGLASIPAISEMCRHHGQAETI